MPNVPQIGLIRLSPVVVFLAGILHRYFCDMLSAHVRKHMMVSVIIHLRRRLHISPF